MKRIIAFIISAVMLFSVIPVFAADAESGRLGLLSELGIMSGDPDGNLRLDDYVSRAEFTKIAVASSAYKNSVATNLAISPFPDVTYKHWAAPYVRVGVTNGVVSGYPDGTFKPEDTVLYEEAITMLLRVLGYTDADFGVSWPSGQIGLANNLDMTDNVNCVAGDIMNRRQVAMLVYNTLKTKQKNSVNTLLSVFDATVYADTTLVAGSGEDSSIASDEVFTSNGTFKITPGFDISGIGSEGDAIVKDGNKLIAFVPDASERAAEEYIVYSVLGNNVMAYLNGSVRQIEIDDDTPAYKGTGKITFGTLKAQLEMGDRIKVRLSDSGDVDYVTYGKGNVAGPVTAMAGNWKAALGVSDNATITRNGASAAEADIINYDIVYYLKDLNAVMAYNTKITGIYEKATPNRDIPTSVTVSGKEYELEGSAAFNKLYSGGTFEYGDTVTLLLGRNNKVADVISPTANTGDIVGYLIGTGAKEYSSGELNTYKNYYIKVVQTDGTEYEFVTDRDYTESKNSVVEVFFSDGYARVKTLDKAGISGTFDWENKKLGSNKISPNIEILDIGTTDKSIQGIYAKVYGPRIDGVSLSEKSVMYSKKNISGEITKLILNNVTNDAYYFGILLSAPSKSGGGSSTGIDRSSGTYEFIVDGSRYSLNTSSRFSASKYQGIKISGNLQNPDTLIALDEVNGKITSITADRIIAGDTTYLLSDRLTVYKRASMSSDEYSMISLDDVIAKKDSYSITAFYDKTTKAGGRVRVIVVMDKNN